MAEVTAAPIPDSVEVVTDVEFGTGGGRPLKGLMLLPKGRPEGSRSPAIIYIYGGWWRLGSPESAIQMRGGNFPVPLELARRGYVVAAVDYRLSQESLFPAQIEDVKCGVRYLRAHADQYGVDPDRIGCFGPSAGGHLSALLGTSGNAKELEGTGGWADQPSNVQAACDWYGPTDILQLGPEHDVIDSPGSQLIGGLVQENKEAAGKVSPMTYLSADCPPFLIMHGDIDEAVIPLQSHLLYDALQKAGIESQLVIYPGKAHEYLGTDAVDLVAAFFDRHLRA